MQFHDQNTTNAHREQISNDESYPRYVTVTSRARSQKQLNTEERGKYFPSKRLSPSSASFGTHITRRMTISTTKR